VGVGGVRVGGGVKGERVALQVGRVCMRVRTTETQVKPEDASRTGAW
jgi:hypothetical protein